MASSDINNFSSSPHRLPTLSASQALHNLSSTPRKPITTGLKSLDAALQGRDYHGGSQPDPQGGISRGEVTELYGPPGVGKSTLAMQVAASVLQAGESVVWVDGSYGFVGSRLRAILSRFSGSEDRQPQPPSSPSSGEGIEANLEKFHQFITPTLPHLLALFTHQVSSFPPAGTTMIVVDSVSTLLTLAFPKTSENTDNQHTPVKKSDAAHWASGRRWAVTGDLLSRLGRLAATRNLAVLLTSQTTTRVRSDTGAMLQPAVSGTAWDNGVGSRIVLFRDWMFQSAGVSSSQGEYMAGLRFAGVVKAKGVTYEGVGRVSSFRIGKKGLQELSVDHADIRRNSSPALPATSLKRKRGEIADSQSEEDEADSDQEFGWAGDQPMLTAEGLLE